MTERGWFHPDRGYWQTTGDVPEEIISAYPDGTTEVSVKPGPRYALDAKTRSWRVTREDPSVRLQLAKEECRRRIYAVASAEAQLSMGAALSIASSKPVSSRSADEKKLIADASKFSDWVGAMRETAARLALQEDADISADDLWPACPDVVLARVSSF